MARPRIIHSLWRDGTMLAPSSQDPQHPAIDTQADTKSMFYKALSLTAPCKVPNDLITPQVIDFVAILDHNFGAIGAGITIKFQGATNSGFTTGVETETLAPNPTNIHKFFTAWAAKPYVRVLLEKAAGDFDDYPQFANVICGKHFELNRSEREGYGWGPEDPSVVEEGDSGVAFAWEKPRKNVGNFPFVGINDAVRAEILSFLDKVGVHNAFVLCFDYADPNNESVWVRNSEAVIPKWVGVNNCWSWELRVREIK